MNFGSWNICESLYDWILNNLESKKTILEFGSGEGSTQELSKYHNLISIEHDYKWVGKYKSHYIWAPIIDYDNYKWYDIDIINKHLKNKSYDLILVDGPVGLIGRMGFYYNRHLFNLNIPIIIDDIERKEEKEMFELLKKELNREYYKTLQWGVLL